MWFNAHGFKTEDGSLFGRPADGRGRESAWGLQVGGMGHYHDRFVRNDTGRMRRWEAP